jgi:hypothetical protein
VRRFALALLAALSVAFAASGETVYRVDSAAGPIQLELYDDGAMRLRLSRPTDLETSTRALTDLLAQAFPSGGLPASRTSIDLGRIVEHPWLSQQLAEAALRSPRWNAARGKPRTGNDNLAVMMLIDDGKLLAAWVPIFGRWGKSIRNASVEKVLVGEVGQTAELAPLAADPAAVGKRLPFDAILWLALEPLRR